MQAWFKPTWHPTALNYLKSYNVKDEPVWKSEMAGQLRREPLQSDQSLSQSDSPSRGEILREVLLKCCFCCNFPSIQLKIVVWEGKSGQRLQKEPQGAHGGTL